MTRREEAETRRILDRYRRLVLLGAVRLPRPAALRLVGPDCAYHLYFLYFRTSDESPRGRGVRRRK
jgi:hypothetical protein